ncbi:polysaccharide deacetylase family protein [Roseiconus lacunae]|uniref:polysaccharide deacetylase family protein n=1 Tax=Roseiconus lacunae TaxID=2605694 RepID=UPI0011F27CC3|nr:polysaccharide deacetylase family protein [Roseiconus lacunae]
MLDTRQIGLHAYYLGTSWWRKQSREKLRQTGQLPVCSLFYHRVADAHPNPWSISCADFERQIRWLQQEFELISLPDLQRRVSSGNNDRMAVAITFDDGYAENMEFAIPLLLDLGIPVTYFVTFGFMDGERAFPHDLKRGIPLPTNTIDDCRWMAEQGVEIGAHTRSHCDVGGIADRAMLIDEVVTATEELSEAISRPIRYFAFPYGKPENMSQAAVDLTRQMGLKGVCSAYGAYNFPGEDPYHIQRIHADPEFIRFKNWLTIDPRKTSIGRGFKFLD